MRSSGELLLKIVDGERQAVDEAFERTERLMLDSRKRVEASDGLEAAALQGHEVAAYRQVLETVIGWEEPNYENARYWCQRAADWDHEPAKRLLALMHERGWGGPVDLDEAAKWNAAAQEQRQPQQKADAPGGLSLEPKARASASSAGSVMRDLVGWVARDGNPHAAYHMGTSDQHGRHGGPVDMAQARAWYAQAAEAGHADATYNLAIFVEEGTGGPKDALAAKALFMLAHARGSTARAEGLRVSTGEQGTVRALVAALREPGRLRSVLRERGAEAGKGGGGTPARAAGGSAAAAVAASSPPSTGRVRTRVEEPDGSDEPDAPERTPMSWHLGHLALAIGAANAVLLIAFVKPGASFRAGMLVLGLVAAFGAWRTARDFEWSPIARALAALLAAIPVAGMAVSLGLLFKAFRARG
jgi:TPR repeat protein